MEGPAPPNKPNAEERCAALEMINRADYASLTPHQVVPKLADVAVP